MATQVGNSLALGAVFVHGARRYWLSAFPQICKEIGSWHQRAYEMPEGVLRDIALAAHTTKRGNLEGAGAFAAFTSSARRPAVIRAQIAFQAIYDYVDTLAEQPTRDPISNGRQLHQALLISLDPGASHCDYYAYHAENSDAGYLAEIVDACRAALETLPSYSSVAESARRLAGRIVDYQSFNLTRSQGSHTALEHWAANETPPRSGLFWWETAASAGSSLGIFALIALASRCRVSLREASAVENAYFPWIGSLHSLLDSLIDLPEDIVSGQQNLITHYASNDEMADRMQAIVIESVSRSESLPNSKEHVVVLVGMACFYLSAKEARLRHAQRVRERILVSLGGLASPTMFVFSARRAVHSWETKLASGHRL